MEHCPLCDRDTACTNAVFGQLPIYHCIECYIVWKPGKSRSWSSDGTGKFNPRDLISKGLLPA